MSEATVVIKGRNELNAAVKSAERDLKRLAQVGETTARLLRGGAIVGAVLAFERLAENAQKAAEQIGDKGTARALKQLNTQIDALKAKGTNVIGKVLGSFAIQRFGTEYDKLIESTQFQIDELKKKLAGGTFGFVVWGPGGRAGAERDLAQYEALLRRLQQNQPYGLRASAPGGRNRRGTPGDFGVGSSTGKPKAVDPFPEIEVYARQMHNFANDQADAFAEINRAAMSENLKFFADLGNEQNEEIEKMIERGREAYAKQAGAMTVYADQAARNIQDSFAQFLFDPFEDGLEGMAKGFVDTIRRMVAEAASSQILQAFFSWGASTFGGGVGAFFGQMGKGLTGRASGGYVGSGKPYLVGERGPELFIPGASGSIIPNGAGGLTVAPVFNIDARGATVELTKALPRILKESEDRTVSKVRELVGRGRL